MKKLKRLQFSTYDIDIEKDMNDRLNGLGIYVDDIISIQEFNDSLYPYVVIWYKVGKL